MKLCAVIAKSMCSVLVLLVLSTSPATAQTITQIIDYTGDGIHPLTNACGIAVDGLGNVYLTGQLSHNAFKITPGGDITQILNSSGNGTGTVQSPSGIAVDYLGNVYVSNTNYDSVLKIAPGGSTTKIIRASNGLDSPGGVTVDASGNVYVVGKYSDNAFKITPDGVISKIIDSTGDGAGHMLYSFRFDSQQITVSSNI